MGVIDSERQDRSGPTDNGVVAVSPPRSRPGGSRSALWLPMATLIVGVLITGALALVSHAQYTRNEKRLLKLRVRDAAALVAESLPGIETPLASTAELANATNGNAQSFTRYTRQYIGTAGGTKFVSISLWNLSAPQHGPVAVAGLAPKLAVSMPDATTFFSRAARAPSMLSVIDLLQPPGPRVGYAFAAPGVPGGFAVYGERAIRPDRRSRLQNSTQFAGLNYALYSGRGVRPSKLLVTNLSNPPPRGRTDTELIPFADTTLTLVMSSRGPLAGTLPQRLPWIIAVVGTLLSVAAAAGTLRLVQRRRTAERMAGNLEIVASENRRLYAEQRGIAQTLQHALLPDHLPEIPGVQTSARYEAGEHGVEIGGDWYDVIDLQDGQLLIVVGDVSGRGLRAATTMATLRYAIHAYAAQKDPPAEILKKLSYLVSVADTGQLATILCTHVDVPRRELRIASAGHLPPLLLSNGQGQFLVSEVGLPIGVEAGASYTTSTVFAPRSATFVAFTDGLVEQRGEDLDHGLARLQDAATGNDAALPQLLGELVRELPHLPSDDDIAIVGLRWTT